MRLFFLGEGMPPEGCSAVPLTRDAVPRFLRARSSFALLSPLLRQAARFRCAAASQRERQAIRQGCLGPPAALGFKWMLNQGFAEALLAEGAKLGRFIAARGGRVLHLVRRDLVAREAPAPPHARLVRLSVRRPPPPLQVSLLAMRQARLAGYARVHKATSEAEAKRLASERVTADPRQLVAGVRAELERREGARALGRESRLGGGGPTHHRRTARRVMRSPLPRGVLACRARRWPTRTSRVGVARN